MLGMIAFVVASPVVHAGTITYSADYGTLSGDHILFSNISESTTVDETDPNPLPLFGAPTILPELDQLLFFPNSFVSKSEDGISHGVSSLLQVTLQATQGTIDTIQIREFGSYTLTGVGTASAQVHGALTVTPLAGAPIEPQQDDFSELFDTSPSAGTFDGLVTLDFSDYSLTTAQLTFKNTLQTTSSSGTVAEIQKHVLSGPAVALAVNSDPVPIPGAFWLLGSGVIGLWGARRKLRGRGHK